MSLDLIREQLELHIDDCRDEIAELCAGHASVLESMNAEHAAALAVLQGELERSVNAMAALDGDVRAETFDTDSDIVRRNSPSDERSGLPPATLPVLPPSGPVGKPEIPPKKRGTVAKHDRAEVARIARQAIADGRPLAKTVAATLGVTQSMGSWLVQQARKSGEDIPKSTNGGGRPRKHRPAVVFVCVPEPDEADLAALEVELAEVEAVDPVVNVAAKRLAAIGASPEPPPLRKVRQPVGLMEWPKREPVVAVTPVDLTTEDPAVDPLAQLSRCKLSLEMVALIYLEAREQNLPGARVLAERFGVHRTVANRWLGLCREGRLLPGRDEAQFDPDAPANVLGGR